MQDPGCSLIEAAMHAQSVLERSLEEDVCHLQLELAGPGVVRWDEDEMDARRAPG